MQAAHETAVLNHDGLRILHAVYRIGTTAVGLQIEGAITAGGNVVVRGGANIQGRDSIPPGWSGDCSGVPEVDKAGVIVPIGATVTTQGASWVQGVPPTKQDPLASDANTYIRYGDETWNTLVAQANVSLNGGSFNNIFPDSLATGASGDRRRHPWRWPGPSGPRSPGLARASRPFPFRQTPS